MKSVFTGILVYSIVICGYSQSGTLDIDFGQNGVVFTNIGQSKDNCRAIALQSDGKIVVGGDSYYGPGLLSISLARYTTDGILDESFGDGGIVTSDITSGSVEVYALAIQSDQKIIIGGKMHPGYDLDFVLMRFNSNGTRDTGFGANGIVYIDFGGEDECHALQIQSDGKILACGVTIQNNNDNFALVRLNVNGAIDSTFGIDGLITTDFVGRDDVANALLLQEDGNIIAVGTSSSLNNNDFALARYLHNGILDPTFGNNGKVTINIGTDSGNTAQLQPDGKIIVGGTTNNDFALLRLYPNGTLDNSFSDDGKLTTNITFADLAYSVLLQPDGKIISSGYTRETIAGEPIRSFAALRYLENGALDSTFGTNGIVIQTINGWDTGYASVLQPDGKFIQAGQSLTSNRNVEFALSRYHGNGVPDQNFGLYGSILTNVGGGNDHISAISPLSDGKVLIGGSSYTGISFDFFVAKYLSDGELDSTFNSNGTITTDFLGSDDFCNDMVVQVDGKIILGGYARNAGDFDFALIRYNSDGNIDQTYGVMGKVVINLDDDSDILQSLSLQADGKLLACGYVNNNGNYLFVLTRFLENGSLDLSFGINGIVKTDLLEGTAYAMSLVVQQDGKIIVAGRVNHGNNSKFAMVRYNSNGNLDNGFGVSGIVKTDVVPNNSDDANEVLLQPDGKILLLGTSRTGGNKNFTLIRYNSDGSLDNSFGEYGIAFADFGGSGDTGSSLALQPDNKIIVCGYSDQDGTNDIALARFNTDGSIDMTFGNQGKIVVDLFAGSSLARVVSYKNEKIIVGGNIRQNTNWDVILISYLVDVVNNVPDITSSNMKAMVFPNPTQNETVIQYTLSVPSYITIQMYNSNNQLIKSYINGDYRISGIITESISLPPNLPPGNYYFKITSNKGASLVKIIKI